MTIERQRAGARTAMWRISLIIVLGWMFLTVLQAAIKLYIVQEILSVLLAMAVATAGLMLIPVTFILFQCGARRALPWLKTNVARLAISIFAMPDSPFTSEAISSTSALVGGNWRTRSNATKLKQASQDREFEPK